jgi:CheY-like chemotaxis protein
MKITNVVLVEDDQDDAELFAEFYQGRKDIALVSVVANGLELVAYLKSIQADGNLPHLIVIDQNMPKMNGKQTLAFLKSNPRYSKIPAVIYSTYTDSNLVSECLELGARMVAVKPIDHEGYQKMMDEWLRAME